MVERSPKFCVPDRGGGSIRVNNYSSVLYVMSSPHLRTDINDRGEALTENQSIDDFGDSRQGAECNVASSSSPLEAAIVIDVGA